MTRRPTETPTDGEQDRKLAQGDRLRPPTELAQAMRLFSGRMSTAILKYPSGRYGLVGSIPYELTELNPRGTPQIPPLRRSLVWETEQEVIDALLGIGCTRFQLADCSWYQA